MTAGDDRLDLALRTMEDYALITGLEGEESAARRYLWTDAFAVCNYLEIFCEKGEKRYCDMAVRLVDQVHHTLGRHRADDPRKGWISGLDDLEGERHPTLGGLRIGKTLNERGANEPPNERLEWDRDGQYYHYLTKWMHALRCVYRVAEDPVYWRWAVELAKTAHSRFIYSPGRDLSRVLSPHGSGSISLPAEKRMYWKMNIDLTRPQVLSMGQHDPLDGFVTYCELEAAGEDLPDSGSLNLKAEIKEMAEICQMTSLPTSDPLGIGGLLFDGTRIAQLIARGFLKDTGLLETVLGSALVGLRSYVRGGELSYPAEHRLAFREMGLAIGLAAVKDIREFIEVPDHLPGGEKMRMRLEALEEFLPLRGKIEQFWSEEVNREAATWVEHREINMVMYATSLAPGQFLLI